MIEDRRPVVYQANPLIEGRKPFGTIEMRLFLLALQHVNPHLSKDDKFFDQRFEELHLTPTQTKEIFGHGEYLNRLQSICDGMAQKVVTVDVGGGSTELAAGALDKGVTATASMPVGGSSLKQIVSGESFDVESVEYAVDDFVSDVDLAPFRWAPGTAYVIIGGIASTLAAWMRDAGTMDPQAMDGAELLVDELAAAGEMFFRLSPEEMAGSGCVIPGREDSIGYAGLVLSIVLTALKAQTVVVSSGGVAQALTDDERWNKLLRSTRR